MSNVIAFRYPALKRVPLAALIAAAECKPTRRGPAEIILFPGIALERWQKPAPQKGVRKPRKTRAAPAQL